MKIIVKFVYALLALLFLGVLVPTSNVSAAKLDEPVYRTNNTVSKNTAFSNSSTAMAMLPSGKATKDTTRSTLEMLQHIEDNKRTGVATLTGVVRIPIIRNNTDTIGTDAVNDEPLFQTFLVAATVQRVLDNNNQPTNSVVIDASVTSNLSTPFDAVVTFTIDGPVVYTWITSGVVTAKTVGKEIDNITYDSSTQHTCAGDVVIEGAGGEATSALSPTTFY